MKFVLLLGTQGAGKSSILSALKGIDSANLGDLMLEESKKYGIKERDEIRYNLEDKKIEEIRNKCIRKLLKKSGKMILSTHSTIKAGSKFLPGFSEDDMRILRGKVESIIYLDAPTEDILERRRKDKDKRKREEDTREEIELDRSINISASIYMAMYFSAPLYFVMNKKGMLDKAAKEVKEIFGRKHDN
ncbi:MAG: AAA family ATPase [Candidatus Micrarchaeaceae archaeon]